jgi:hypothetical protein
MTRRGMLLLATPVLAGLAGAPASAQTGAFPLRVPAQATGLDGRIQVNVSYSLSLPLKGDDLASQTETLESARRSLYGIAAGECKVLMSTIARTCGLERLNVQANVRRQRGEDHVHVSANATYRIELK